MKMRDYKNLFVQQLAPLYDEMEVEQFFYMILESRFNLRRIDLALKPELSFNEEELVIWDQYKFELSKFKPIQYLLGEAHFYGLTFKVDENVLIPRPETEELVEWIIETAQQKFQNNPIKILDIGTGSGCIAISLAKNLPNAKVSAIDVSDLAFAKAKLNANLNEVNVDFILQDILQAEGLADQYDIIVSNPPYIRNLEKVEIKENVLQNEPHLALFVEDDNALIFYVKITQLAQKYLNNEGVLFFEINQYLGEETVKMIESYDFRQVILRKDIYENDRMIRANRGN